MTDDEIVEMLGIFLPDGSNEARLVNQVDTHINKVIELGFLRRVAGQDNLFEVRRILKAFVDGQWLAGFEEGLALGQPDAPQRLDPLGVAHRCLRAHGDGEGVAGGARGGVEHGRPAVGDHPAPLALLLVLDPLLGGGEQQIMELAEDVLANGVALVDRGQVAIGAFVEEMSCE